MLLSSEWHTWTCLQKFPFHAFFDGGLFTSLHLPPGQKNKLDKVANTWQPCHQNHGISNGKKNIKNIKLETKKISCAVLLKFMELKALAIPCNPRGDLYKNLKFKVFDISNKFGWRWIMLRKLYYEFLLFIIN